jgi:flagellar hook protein FlgE
MANPSELDRLGAAGSDGTPPVKGSTTAENKSQLTRDELIALAQSKLNDELNRRHLEFGKPSTWPTDDNPPIRVGYDVAARSFTFTVDPAQMGPDANEPASRFNSIQVFNPTDTVNDLGIPSKTESSDTLIRANTVWTGSAALPAGDPIVDPREQRTGIVVTYNKDTRQFQFLSGSTGEASDIEVGRAILATSTDVQSQINSYDLSALDFSIAQSVRLEVDGRTLIYNYTPPPGNSSTNSAAFFAGIQQQNPVNFSAARQVADGTSTTAEIQSLKAFGKLMNNDRFTLSIAPAPGLSPVDVPVGPLTIASTDSTSDRLTNLKNAVQSAITTYNALPNTTDINVVVTNSANELTFTYGTPYGAVASVVSMKQTARGTDVALGTAIDLTDVTVISGQTNVVDGTGTTPSVHTVPLLSSDGLTPTLQIGDVYRISIPLADGSVVTKDVAMTAAGIAGLVSAADSAGFGAVDFSNSGNSLVATYNGTGNITGKMTVEQVKAAGTMVRPADIGPFSVGNSGTNLEITGDPSGKPFRLNLRINGVVRPMFPVGAQGSTSRVNLQVGEAKSIGYTGSNDLLGIGNKYSAQQRFVQGTGLTSTAATAVGARGVTPMGQTFFLNESLGENRMTFTVDGIVGTITLPIRAYTGDTFASAIKDRVNQIQDPKTGRTVSGVEVKFDANNNRLVFTSGTAGSNSQINVVGHANFGLASVTQTPGEVPIITNLEQATDASGNKLYVDSNGNITTQSPTTLQNWYPLYLQEGQLTFDTVGKLISPKEGVIYSPFDPQNGSDLLRLTIDYGKFSTQYSSPFSVLSLSQDGFPSGSLNGLDIDASGTIRANYTNGQTVALGKVMIANFANPNGMKQIGNANYVATSVSGQVVLGQAGADGFGTIKAGALERSNVDITEELVNLITAQRNFQANAKAIETTTQLSQTIIQIRG